jgi:hypothetical protein
METDKGDGTMLSDRGRSRSGPAHRSWRHGFPFPGACNRAKMGLPNAAESVKQLGCPVRNEFFYQKRCHGPADSGAVGDGLADAK